MLEKKQPFLESQISGTDKILERAQRPRKKPLFPGRQLGPPRVGQVPTHRRPLFCSRVGVQRQPPPV